MDNRECEDTPRPEMSEIKLDDVGAGIPVNRFSSGLHNHNLTGTRSRFQPVRIKALLDQFESDDEDTEPRDSDDNSDAESLQALPDDDEADHTREESVSPIIKEGIERVSVAEEVDMSQKARKSEDIMPEIILPPSVRKTMTLVPYNFDVVDKPSLLTPRSSHFSSHAERRENSDGLSGLRNLEIDKFPQNSPKNVLRVLETPLKAHSDYPQNLDGQNSFKNVEAKSEIEMPMKFPQNGAKSVLKVLETPLKKFYGDYPQNLDGQNSLKNGEMKSEIETPMKFPQNGPKSVLKVLETPLKKAHSDYPQNVVETPGVIFSHWSRNNYLQTPTAYNPMLTSTKKEEAGAHFQDPSIGSQRFFNSENRPSHRKPLGEATHFNQPDRPALEQQNLVRRTLQLSYAAQSGLLAKENTATEVKENVGNTARRSLIERDNPAQQGNTNCAEAVSLGRTEPKATVKCEGVSPMNNNFEIEERNGGPKVVGSEASKQSMLENVNSKSSNPVNVQFSVAAKPKDKKYGQLINVKGSDYVVLGKLGQGMSGNVLRVQDIKTGELRAIKCVDLSQIDKETAQGCLEEVALLVRLRAPCIIHMFTYEIKSHWLYVVLEMGDTDLSKLLKSMPRDEKLPLTMILYYWTEMLTAVQHIHDNDVIHSDLKPANFLLVRGRLKLIDFGIASTLNSDMTSVVKNTSLGTLHYISPEAIEDVGGNGDSPSGNNKYKLNFQSDVWSLGCILYGLVYGQTPFEHIRADWAKVAAITNPKQKISFPPVQAIGRRGHSSPPPFLVDVMRRCLQHDKKARPTVRQLLEIPYVGCNCPPASSLPSISPAILLKIKESLGESEWRQLLDTLERRRPLQ